MRSFITSLMTRVKNIVTMDIFLFLFFWCMISVLYVQAARDILENEKILQQAKQQEVFELLTKVQIGKVKKESPEASTKSNVIAAEQVKFKKILK